MATITLHVLMFMYTIFIGGNCGLDHVRYVKHLVVKVILIIVRTDPGACT